MQTKAGDRAVDNAVEMVFSDVRIGALHESAELITRASTLKIAINAPKNPPSFDDTYQMHTGVLDTLRR